MRCQQQQTQPETLPPCPTKRSFSNYGTWVALGAPGGGILSTLPSGSYGTYSGTSMACPHVSGAAGGWTEG